MCLTVVGEKCGWMIVREGCAGTIVWVVTKEDIGERLRALGPRQRLARIPGMLEACRKVAMASAMRKQDEELPFWPRTWQHPRQSVDIICAEAFSGNKQTSIIFKPDGTAQGHGIFICQSEAELRQKLRSLPPQNGFAILQEYVDRPLLLDGFKWDARIYALVLPVEEQFAVFLARDGLVRVCSDVYESAAKGTGHRVTAHLTNYSLNKFSEKFEYNEDPKNASQGNKRTLSAVFERLQKERGVSTEKLWNDLKTLTYQAVNALHRQVEAAAFGEDAWEAPDLAAVARRKFGRCFQILGIDVLLGDDLQWWLLEVNNNPSLCIDDVRPLSGTLTRAETNQLFAERMKEAKACLVESSSGYDDHPRRSLTIGDQGSAAVLSQSSSLLLNPACLSKWGRPCRCAKHHRVHTHDLSHIDAAVKLPVVEGTLEIVHRSLRDGGAGDPSRWSEGTNFEITGYDN